MAKKEFTYRGKTLEELNKLSLNEFIQLLPARQRRTLSRGFTPDQQALMKKINSRKQNIETHCRDIIILPQMVGMVIKVHKGTGAWEAVRISDEMIGHRLGEFALSRKRVQHSAPGIGATKSSASVSVR